MWGMSTSVCASFSPYIQGSILINLLGKRLLKFLVINGKTTVENFQQMLRKLRKDFISDVIVNVETNVFRILAEMGSIHENVRALGKDLKENFKGVSE